MPGITAPKVEIEGAPAAPTFGPAQPDPYAEFAPAFKAPENIIIEDPAQGPSEKELRELYEAEKKKNEELAAKAQGSDALAQGFTALGDRLEKVVQRPVSVQQTPAPAPGETFEAFKARVERDFIEKPYEAMSQIVERVAGPAFQALGTTIERQSKTIARLTADDPAFFQKHEDEINSIVAQMSPQERVDPNAYSRAYNLVKVQHLDELVEMKLQARMGAQGAGAASAAPAAPAQARAVPSQGFNPESGAGALPGVTPSNPGAPAQAEKIRITRAQADFVRRTMTEQAIPDDQFELTVELMRDRGMI